MQSAAPIDELIQNGFITVCGWCYPGDSIYAARPELRGLNLRISHGICAEHKAQMMSTVPSVKPLEVVA